MKLFPENVSTYGADIDNIFWLVFVFATIAFVISLFVLLYPLFRYHYKRVKKAEYIDGTKWKHMRWVALAVILLGFSDFVILFKEGPVWSKVQNVPQEKDFHVAVIGRQWNWIFVYPGPDNELYTADDVIVDEQNSSLHVPVNKKVVVDIRARDVLHSFFIPNVRLKYDAIPGRTIMKWFEITKPGKYELICAEICGILHAKMRNYVVAESEEEFRQYLNTLYQPKEQKNS